ncbi:MAG: YkgJ family cysteine cluster protein [Polyangiaceae bacterium]|nr:YkgJ family cysteine cluster protein [Polyangiaceae bacterium]
MASGLSLLHFRCTSCGNCCKTTVVPLTSADLRALVSGTGLRPDVLVQWLAPDEVDMTGEPETFALLDVGRRLMALRREPEGCSLLDAANQCSAYAHRPRACRAYPLSAEFGRRGGVRRLRLLRGLECDHATDGRVSVPQLRHDHAALRQELAAYALSIADWNRLQRRRQVLGKRLHGARALVERMLASGSPSRGM